MVTKDYKKVTANLERGDNPTVICMIAQLISKKFCGNHNKSDTKEILSPVCTGKRMEHVSL